MSVKSTAFGGITLTGEDAKKFVNQVKFGRPSKAAIEGVRRGDELLKEYKEKGYVKVSVK